MVISNILFFQTTGDQSFNTVMEVVGDIGVILVIFNLSIVGNSLIIMLFLSFASAKFGMVGVLVWISYNTWYLDPPITMSSLSAFHCLPS
jgi:hypothetical protein